MSKRGGVRRPAPREWLRKNDRGFTCVPNALWCIALSNVARCVWAFQWSLVRVRKNGDDYLSYVAQTTIAQTLGISTNTVRRCDVELVDAGLLELVQAKPRRPKVYRVRPSRSDWTIPDPVVWEIECSEEVHEGGISTDGRRE
ncbi:hypothetical protein AMJ82_05715 [candidate division TA06 bacterium SM23_40]|uniref:Uncharacterized protein n=1 Tax=candidate division TA06 bacterium SM23_40 TaxID=1703774 RepID=A0A0S8GC39_UNCT6|nr:MAG: hypothetical protein AMJ82_05715 [candidate division TA06 bacterium SM23_40]